MADINTLCGLKPGTMQCWLPPISSLLTMHADPDCSFSQPHFRPATAVPESLPTSVMELLRSGALAPQEQPSGPEYMVQFLLEKLRREQMKTRMLHTTMLMQSATVHMALPRHMTAAYDNTAAECRSEESASGTKRHSPYSKERVFSRKKRVHVKSACVSCKNSHIACDDAQPCRNCVRRGCNCDRTQIDPLSSPSDKAPAPKAAKLPSKSRNESECVRKYVKAACSCCHKSHLACDEYRPCRNCVRLGLREQCAAQSKVKEVEVVPLCLSSSNSTADEDRDSETSRASTAALPSPAAPSSPSN